MADKFPKEFIVYSPTRASFEAQVASGEVDNTQIGIIAESGEFWEKGNYHPLVMLSDYLKKTDAVTLAKDLTGRIEATPEEFTFRPSAGTKSIRDESAVIRRIKGNTSVWGQLAEWTGIDNKGQSTLATYEISDNSVDITYNKAGVPGQVYIFSSPLYPAVTGHKYLCTIDVKTSKSLGLMLYPWYDVFLRFTSNQSWTTHSAFYTPTRTEFTNRFYFRFQSATNQTMEIGDSIHCRNLQFFDLTQIFGAGNEPTTIEEFKKLYPESYYSYCEPEVRSMRAAGIETIGANAFNKDNVVGGLINADGTVTSNDIYSVAEIEVVPNETYTLKGVANAVNTIYTYAIYDSRNKVISVGEIKNSVTKPLLVSGDVTMPMTARYLKVVAHSDHLDSCCVNLKHSGTLAPEEATYFKEVRMLPDIAKYFPEGMHGIDDVFDEINEENAIKRFGVVDLGTLTWNPGGTGTTDIYKWQTEELVARPASATSEVPNIICVKYKTGTQNDTWNKIDCITVSSTGRLFLFDSNFTTASDKDAFVASLQGVMLVYEIAEPIVTPITEPLQMDYKVADFGTEKMVSFYPSSPFRADIVYAFNAADRINDNERNIERIEETLKGLATREYVQDYVASNAPAVAAPAMPIVNVTKSSLTMAANTIYYYTGGIGIAIEEFVNSVSEDNLEDVWILRFAPSSSMMQTLTLPSYLQNVYWEEGSSASMPVIGYIYEFQFRKINYSNILVKRIVYIN